MKYVVTAILLGCLSITAFASNPSSKTSDATPESESKKQAEDKDNIVASQHSVRIGNETIHYTAHAGTMIIKDEEGVPRASMFFVSYTKDGAEPTNRPITYTFNGGPGSSSIWLHMGAFGPRRVAYGDDSGHAAKPPYHLVDNEYSILDVTDLLFIDPVTTGYSRAIPFKDASKYHGLTSDVQSVGDFIRLWTSRNKRWSSPKYLAGESYGTTRAAALSGYLNHQGMYLNGIVLISSILNFGTTEFDPGNDLAYVLILPSYATTAWYHHKLSANLQSQSVATIASEAEQFALGEYTAALMKGDGLGESDRKAMAAKVSKWTGLSPAFVDEANLRVSLARFDKELLRDERHTAGRLDSRFQGSDRDSAGEEPEFDPSLAAIKGEYTAVLNDYVRRDLQFETDLHYEVLTEKVWPWSFDNAENRYVDVAETLRQSMNQNPYMRVFVASGYYDLATPFAATKYTFSRMGLDPVVKKNLSMDFMEAGHMVYIDRTAHARLKKDIEALIRSGE